MQISLTARAQGRTAADSELKILGNCVISDNGDQWPLYVCMYVCMYVCVYVCLLFVKPIYPLNHAAETQSALFA